MKYLGKSDPKWVCLWHFTGWSHISLGFHVSLSEPNVEFHLPFGLIRVGRTWTHHYAMPGDKE